MATYRRYLAEDEQLDELHRLTQIVHWAHQDLLNTFHVAQNMLHERPEQKDIAQTTLLGQLKKVLRDEKDVEDSLRSVHWSSRIVAVNRDRIELRKQMRELTLAIKDCLLRFGN